MDEFRKDLLVVLVGLLLVGGVAVAGTMVPGHQKRVDKNVIDVDDNGYPDEGRVVNGKYTSVYAYDGVGNWYWDLGDGRIQGNVDSISDLDGETSTVCDYQIQYRGTFDNDPYMDSGWIINNINCRGYDDNENYNYLIVHETDPRYTGNPSWSVWGNWEYKVLTISGFGNFVRPEGHVGGN